MSFYFYVPTDKKVSYQALTGALTHKEIEYSSEEKDSENDIEGTKIFIPGRSTRGVTIALEEDGFAVGLNIMASEEDFALALDVTETLSRLTGGPIQPEDEDEPINLSLFKEKFDREWVDYMKLSGVSLFLEEIGQEQHKLTIGCCYMSFTVGPRIHAQMETDKGELAYFKQPGGPYSETSIF